MFKRVDYYKEIEGMRNLAAVDKAYADCRDAGYLLDYLDREEFQTMMVERYTLEQQIEDRVEYEVKEAVEAAFEAAVEANVLEIAKKLLNKKTSIEDIVQVTGLKYEHIETLSND